MQESLKKEFMEWGKAIIFALVIVFVIKYFLFDMVAIDGISMHPTLFDKDRVFVNVIEYKIGHPNHKDVIVFTPPVEEGSYYIKRVIGVEGDIVRISNGKVYVNDVLQNEDYLSPGTVTEGNMTVTVPKDMVFVLGDNREHSEDSRFFGSISIKSIKGHAIFRIYPLNKMVKL